MSTGSTSSHGERDRRWLLQPDEQFDDLLAIGVRWVATEGPVITFDVRVDGHRPALVEAMHDRSDRGAFRGDDELEARIGQITRGRQRGGETLHACVERPLRRVLLHHQVVDGREPPIVAGADMPVVAAEPDRCIRGLGGIDPPPVVQPAHAPHR